MMGTKDKSPPASSSSSSSTSRSSKPSSSSSSNDDHLIASLISVFGARLKSHHPEILDRLLLFSKTYQISAEDLHSKWEALIMDPKSGFYRNHNQNHGGGDMMEIDGGNTDLDNGIPTMEELQGVFKRLERNMEAQVKTLAASFGVGIGGSAGGSSGSTGFGMSGATGSSSGMTQDISNKLFNDASLQMFLDMAEPNRIPTIPTTPLPNVRGKARIRRPDTAATSSSSDMLPPSSFNSHATSATPSKTPSSSSSSFSLATPLAGAKRDSATSGPMSSPVTGSGSNTGFGGYQGSGMGSARTPVGAKQAKMGDDKSSNFPSTPVGGSAKAGLSGTAAVVKTSPAPPIIPFDKRMNVGKVEALFGENVPFKDSSNVNGRAVAVDMIPGQMKMGYQYMRENLADMGDCLDRWIEDVSVWVDEAVWKEREEVKEKERASGMVVDDEEEDEDGDGDGDAEGRRRKRKEREVRKTSRKTGFGSAALGRRRKILSKDGGAVEGGEEDVKVEEDDEEDEYEYRILENPAMPHAETFYTAGRILCDSPHDGVKLNDDSVLLECCRSLGGGCKVKLNFGRLFQAQTKPGGEGLGFALFPGQVVGIEGTNPTGHLVFVTRVIMPPELPRVVTPPSLLVDFYPETKETVDEDGNMRPWNMVVAAGPFTMDDNVEYEPLDAFIEVVRKEKPEVVILIGPFVDETHGGIVSGAIRECIIGMFAKRIAPRLRRIMEVRPGVRVVVVPGTCGIESEWLAYPQPPLGARLFEDRWLPGEMDGVRALGLSDLMAYSNGSGPKGSKLMLFPNPVQFAVNEVVVAVSNADSLMHISGEEMARVPMSGNGGPGAPGGPIGASQGMSQSQSLTQGGAASGAPATSTDRMARLFRHHLQQRHLYPISPPPLSDKFSVEIEQVYSGAATLQVTPDLLIIPSALRQVIKNVDGCVCVNPGTLVKGRSVGSFARVCVYPLQVHAMKEMLIDGGNGVDDGVRNSLEERCRVEVVRI
ncbi:DNA-directed DNA polymerase alpha subunit pol12 [Blyttiomyces sp. JEL0837]|nr:DNA-directed DNA polymerase alpha subunit pol12 [Blyttiomyces sp. JEL0837]